MMIMKKEKPVWDNLVLLEMCEHFICVVLFNFTDKLMGQVEVRKSWGTPGSESECHKV